MFEEAPWQAGAAEDSASPASRRDLAQFYSRRAYPGAPPVVPHQLMDKRTMGGRGCLGCHSKGGYVPVFEAYAPVTPHPGWTNCLSCHVPIADKSSFRDTTFVPLARPQIRQAWLPGAPPPIPHSLEYRANCRSCHAGPGAIKEIRTSHPERQNCRQCHASRDGDPVFSRPAVDAGSGAVGEWTERSAGIPAGHDHLAAGLRPQSPSAIHARTADPGPRPCRPIAQSQRGPPFRRQPHRHRTRPHPARRWLLRCRPHPDSGRVSLLALS